MLLDNLNWIFDGLGVALGGWLLVLIYRRFVLWQDSTNIYRWLQANTQDEPHQSHKTMFEISSGAYQLSGAPRNDGERSFSTKERPVVCTKDMQKAIFSEKGTF